MPERPVNGTPPVPSRPPSYGAYSRGVAQSEHRVPRRVTISDPQVMRAMAHPARLAIMEYLNNGAVATATECAEVCGLSPSATSYHLRALAKAGLVEEAPSRGDGRERVWRAPHTSLRIDAESNSPEAMRAARELMDVVLARDDEKIARWMDNAESEPKEWYDAAGLTRHQLVLTAQELNELFQAVERLIEPYGRVERPDPPEGARKVGVLFRAIPID
jgi:DNA-binding transcriptional ArsR family regulator